MDVQLAGEMNGIEAAIAIRREFPRMPVVFYSIQDDDDYYRTFRHSGILSHYAYVRKSNYLLPALIVPLLRDAAAGRSFIDPEIESRVRAGRSPDACARDEQRADRFAHGLPRQADHQPHQRSDLYRMGIERYYDR
jgi:DNA-binding NarL/FixJ family response regulator